MSSTAIRTAVKIPTNYGKVGETVWCCPRNFTSICHYWGDDFRIHTDDPEVGRKLKRLTGVERVAYSVGGGYREIFEMNWAKLRSSVVQAISKNAAKAQKAQP